MFAIRRGIRGILVLAAMFSVLLTSAAAQSPPPGLWPQDALFGDWGGLRSAAGEAGLGVGATYIGETLADIDGGINRTVAYEGRLEVTLDANLAKIATWEGAHAHAGLYQIHGRGLSAPDVGSLVTISNIEAHPSTRLFTLWLEQSLFADKLSVRAGKIAADDEFLISDTAGIFIINSFGWTTWTSLDLLNGGPVYPLAGPGVRLKAAASDQLTLLAAAFSGDPVGAPSTEDPQKRDSSGTKFSFRGGTLFIAEAAYRLNQGDGAAGLPSTFKLGAWAGAGSRFPDQRFDTQGRSLADPASNGIARTHAEDWGIYGIADQTLWQAGGDDQRQLSAFVRLGGSPGPQNLIDFYADTGVAYRGPLPERPNDTAALGLVYSHIGEAARARDGDARRFGDPTRLVRDHEIAVEATYQAQLAPWWLLQPDVQYIIHPGGHVALPASTHGSAIPDALIVGLRFTLKL